MRFVALAVVVCLAVFPLLAEQDSPKVPPPDHFFSGTVTGLTDTSVTVTRTVLGKQSDVRTFAITPETRIEGRPHVKSRVTVRFVSSEQGDRAVHIIVRSNASPKKQP